MSSATRTQLDQAKIRLWSALHRLAMGARPEQLQTLKDVEASVDLALGLVDRAAREDLLSQLQADVSVAQHHQEAIDRVAALMRGES